MVRLIDSFFLCVCVVCVGVFVSKIEQETEAMREGKKKRKVNKNEK